ncbi:hypothetical protein Lser_V15G39983 [Lactuca serriola]
MAYADVQMFMKKLKQLIYSNDIPIIKIPSIVREGPQFQMLYEELGSMIQTLFIHQDPGLENFEKVTNLRKRFKAVAEEAEDIVDLFLSTVHFGNYGYFPRSDVFHPSLNLEAVMRSIDSIKMEFMTMSIDNMKMDASQRPGTLQMQSAGTSRTRNSLRSRKVLEEIVVGIDRDVEIIRDKLAEDGKHLDVVSIVGMGGIGKSTLANKVFSDPFVVYHFHIRGWVTVSQTYNKRDLLIQVLSSIDDQLELEKATDSQLHEKLHRSLYCKRYLIVIDDIWSTEAWDKMKLFFPDHNIGSRILLTSRLTEVAAHAKSHGLIHHLQHLTEEESWKLLCQKVFQGDECPEWLIEPGMQIAKNCHGLPLSVVVMAGVLVKEARNKDLWVKISCSVHSYIASDEKGCLETIALSYDHLPLHLRDCFLYLGGFPEDFLINSPWLLWLWMAEGFIQEDRSRSMEKIANGYLVDLVDRNLLILEKWNTMGDVLWCKVHDLVRQVCVEKGKKERFFLKIDSPPSNHLYEVHLRHLNIWLSSFPTSICNLWNLQTLIVRTSSSSIVLPSNISDLVNLRHLASNANLYLPSIEKPMNLEVLSNVELGEGVDNFQKCFPRIRYLSTTLYSDEENDFEVLHHLKNLMLIGSGYSGRRSVEQELLRGEQNLEKNHIIRFPATLKQLTLERCGLPWSDMSIIQPLPNLEVLAIKGNGFDGTLWETGDEQFQRLKFLKLKKLNIKQWKVSSINFPCLERLEVLNCIDLEEIPLELGDISTLERIHIENCGASLLVSLQKIRQEQDDVGNYELKIKVDGRYIPSYVPQHDD